MRPIRVRFLDIAAIALFGLLALTLAFHLRPAPLLLAAALIAYIAGDLASGLVHFFCDTFFEEDSPLIGRLLIHPFREHHRDPLRMTAHSFAELNGNSCLAMLPTMAAAAFYRDRIPPFLLAAILFFHLSLFATNLFHRWAHVAVVPAPVRWLQKHWLILTPAAHRAHHRNGRGAYCITSGWMNRPLDRILGSR
jgi:ubiquitin-conjugating enzyme E2 variant